VRHRLALGEKKPAGAGFFVGAVKLP
jgi:hypothetical protein